MSTLTMRHNIAGYALQPIYALTPFSSATGEFFSIIGIQQTCKTHKRRLLEHQTNYQISDRGHLDCDLKWSHAAT